MIIVKLTPGEMVLASNAGLMRRYESCIRNSGSFRDWTGDPWNNDIESCRAELAVCKHYGVYWSGSLGDTSVKDAGNEFQVRYERAALCTDIWKRSAKLKIRPRDKDEDIFVGIVGGKGEYGLAGWIRAGDAKQDKYLDNPNDLGEAWFVPMGDLKEIER